MVAGNTDATAGEYSKIETPLGEGSQQTYTIVMAGIEVDGAMMVVQAGNGAGYSMVTVSANDS